MAVAAEVAESAGQEKDAPKYGDGDQAKKEYFQQGDQKYGGEKHTEKQFCGTHGKVVSG